MSDDGVIRIGTEVDISGIKANMAEAAATVKTSCSNMESAYQKLATTTAEYAVTQANLRAVIRQLVEGQVPYTLAVKALTPALMEQSAATKQLQAAKSALIGIENTETQAVRSNMSARMAASAELRVFEGNMMGSTRAAGAFLSMLPGMSAMMQAAFPIFGAVALIQVLGQAVAAVNRLVTAYDNLDGAAIKASTDAILAGEKIAKIKAEHLSADSVARLISGAPGNDDIQVKSAAAALKQIQYARELADAQAAVVEQGKTGVALQRQKIVDAQKDIEYARQAKKAADDLVSSYKAQLEAKTTIGVATTDPKSGVITQPKVINTITDPKQVEAIQSQMRAAVQASEQFNHEIDMMKVKLQGAELKLPGVENKDGLSAARKAAEAQRKAEEEAVEGARRMLDSMKAAHTMTAVEESQFWAGMAVQSKVGSKLYIVGWDEANKATARAQEESKRSLDRWGDEARQQFEQQSRAAEELARKQGEAASAARESSNRIAEAQEKAAQAVQESGLRALEASGSITRLGAAQEQARIHAQAYREELKRLDDELSKLSEDESLTPEQRAQKGGALQAQKAQAQGQMQATGISDQANIQKQISQPYLNAFEQINEGWLQLQTRMMYSTRNLSLEFAKMGQSLLISITSSTEKAVLKAAEHDLMMLIHHRAANQMKVASDAQSAAQSEGISNASMLKKLALDVIGLFHHTATNTAKTAADATSAAASTAATIPANIAMAQSYAAVAAVGAMASVAAIPVVGWAMAPGVGAATLGIGEGFTAMAAFEDGTGYVPRTGVAMLHEGEAIIPAPTMQDLRGSEGGRDLTINHTTNINGVAEREVIKAIRRNPHEIAGALKRHLRQIGQG